MEGARAWGLQGVTAQWVWVSIWGDEKVQELDGMLVTQRCECPKCHQIVHLKMAKLVNFMLSLFYHYNNKSKNPDVWPAPPDCSLLAPVKSSVHRHGHISTKSTFEKDAHGCAKEDSTSSGC